MRMKTNGTRSIGGKLLSLAAVAALAACGGGGGESAPAPVAPATAEGVYAGTASASGTSAPFNLLVLENGEYWLLYGSGTPQALYVEGFIEGVITSNNGVLTSTSGKDFGAVPAVQVTINATYNATAKTMSGTVSSVGFPTATFSAGPDASSTYNYNTPASLSTIAGQWSMTDLAGETLALNVGANGAFTGGGGGCTFSGNITPRPSGKNVFNVTMTFGGAPCALPEQSASGIAVASTGTGGRTQLAVAAIDSTKQYGAVALGTR